jgi:hypothetical protein
MKALIKDKPIRGATFTDLPDDSFLADGMCEGKVTPAIIRKMCYYVLKVER